MVWQWSEVMGWREATLFQEANGNWQRERERLLRNGLDYEAARTQLLDTYEAWMDTPQARLDDETPREVVIAERLEIEEEQDEVDSLAMRVRATTIKQSSGSRPQPRDFYS